MSLSSIDEAAALPSRKKKFLGTGESSCRVIAKIFAKGSELPKILYTAATRLSSFACLLPEAAARRGERTTGASACSS